MSSDHQQAPEGSPAIDDLIERLGESEKETRAEAVKAVGQLSQEMAMEGAGALVPPLVTALRWGRNFGDEVFNEGLRAIKTMGPAAVPHLVDLLDADNYLTVQIACAALARSGDPEGGERGRKLLAEFIIPEPSMIADEWKARNAVAAMEAIGDDEAVDFLANQVLGNHADEFVRSAAAWSLGRLGNPRATAALQKALNDPSTSNVQPMVRSALEKLKGVEPPASSAGAGSPSSSAESGQGKKPWWKFW
jgi:HEAT repeat protein